MKTLLLATVLLATPALTSDAADAAKSPAAEKSAAKRHPLRGVITRVDAEKSTLMVKHEEIPGVMRAMTMMFKVDPQVAAAAKVGQALTAQMSRVNNEWRLDDVKLAK
jgi:Cu/Ag efflux protein CusF